MTSLDFEENPVSIQYASEALIPSMRDCLDAVAREIIYIEMVEAPVLEKLRDFQMSLIKDKAPNFYALRNGEVVGWCDISLSKHPRMLHRGSLGMGLRADHRGRGLGTKLLQAAIEHAKKVGLEKVELSVYTDNLPAIALYRKQGFEEEGLRKKFRKLNGKYYDCLLMAKFL
jgi:RimJ/RimL family protein N-acetyltransferase